MRVCVPSLILLAYRSRLLPASLASGLFWRVAVRSPCVRRLAPIKRVQLGNTTLSLRLPLQYQQNWTLLFNRLDASPDAFTLRVFRHYVRRSSCVFDVGANVGFYFLSALSARNVQTEVHAFEPQGELAALLQDHVHRNVLARAHVVPRAVSSCSGRAQLMIPQSGTMASLEPGFLTRRAASWIESVAVETTSLDDYASTIGCLPDLIKIDVEGHEPSVLEGAKRILESRPTLLVEISAESAHSRPIMTLFELGYLAYAVEGRQLVPVTHAALCEHFRESGAPRSDCLFTVLPPPDL